MAIRPPTKHQKRYNLDLNKVLEWIMNWTFDHEFSNLNPKILGKIILDNVEHYCHYAYFVSAFFAANMEFVADIHECTILKTPILEIWSLTGF